jgi:hypothetical protein
MEVAFESFVECNSLKLDAQSDLTRSGWETEKCHKARY